MAKTVNNKIGQTIARKRKELIAIRTEVEDLLDYLDVLEARTRDAGKPRLSHDEIKKRYSAQSNGSNRGRSTRKAA
ncbi:MAG TPA: hypothetical protein VNG71_22670 [Pyrinomonadaceae bacterium]|nr:hypothetical protein [Pyrinomonadaceae bacterium]